MKNTGFIIKKIYVICAVSILTALLLTGCGSEKKTESTGKGDLKAGTMASDPANISKASGSFGNSKKRDSDGWWDYLDDDWKKEDWEYADGTYIIHDDETGYIYIYYEDDDVFGAYDEDIEQYYLLDEDSGEWYEDNEGLEDTSDEGDYPEIIMDDGIVDSSAWIGYYETDDKQSLSVNPDMGNKLDITAKTYSEEGWSEWITTAVVSSENPSKATMRLTGGQEVALRLESDGIYLDTSSVGGLFMEGKYYRKDQ